MMFTKAFPFVIMEQKSRSVSPHLKRYDWRAKTRSNLANSSKSESYKPQTPKLKYQQGKSKIVKGLTPRVEKSSVSPVLSTENFIKKYKYLSPKSQTLGKSKPQSLTLPLGKEKSIAKKEFLVKELRDQYYITNKTKLAFPDRFVQQLSLIHI